MGKSTARKAYTTPPKAAPTHKQVQRQTKKVNRAKQARAVAISKPTNNDSVFDEGANT